MLITEDISSVSPRCRYPDEWVRPLNQAMARFQIDENIYRAAAFLGQCAHESQDFNILQENLKYSPQRISQVWPGRFPTVESALLFGRNPERLGNAVYANRMGNGPESSGDGFMFRGRGLLQVTGRENYEKVGELMGVQSLTQLPDSLLEPRNAALSAAAYWDLKGLNAVADRLKKSNDLEDVVQVITKDINGGLNGLGERIMYTKRALYALDKELAV